MADEGNEFLRKYGAAGDNPVSAPDYTKKEGERILQALRDAQPSRLRNPPAIVIAGAPQRLEWGQGNVNRNRPADPFTEPASEVTEQTAESIPNIAFIVSDASTFEGTPPVESNKVLVADGKIKGDYPAGMPSGNTYVIDLSNPADSLIYAGITFNPTTLAITSRFIGTSDAAGYPESRVESATEGFIYWLLAFTYFDTDGAFQVVNARVGNINFEITYGSLNGKPALLPVDCEPGWLDLDLA